MAECDNAINIDDLGVTAPETPTFQGCDILEKLRYAEVAQGAVGVISWQLRDPRTGRPVALASSDSSSESAATIEVRVRILDCDNGCGCCGSVPQVTAEITDETCGQLQFTLPDCVVLNAGIYQMHIGVFSDSASTRPLFVDKGLLSVERSAWTEPGSGADLGPPTIGEVRAALRDNIVENLRTGAVEYTTDEILHALVLPVRQWNELPPNVARFTCRTFPFKYHWLRATVGELMRIAAQHYLRNKLQQSGGGMSFDDLNRDREYMQLAELYRTEWLQFVELKKVEINIAGAYGTVHSAYSSRASRMTW